MFPSNNKIVYLQFVFFCSYVNQTQYEHRRGSAEDAIRYLNTAIGLKPEDELPYMVRSKCLIK